MGQASSRGSASPPDRRRRRASVLGRLNPQQQPAESPERPARPRSSRPRPLSSISISPFTRLRSETPDAGPSTSADDALVRRRSRLTRARSSFTTSIPNIFSRRSTSRTLESTPLGPSSPERPLSSTRPPPRQAVSDETFLPRLPMPEIALDFDDLAAAVDPPRRDSQRSMHNLSDRISSLRPDRGIRNMTSSLRRRRSPLRRGEDQAAMLSRLLSVAAAATAATLMGGDHRAVSEARDIAGDGDDGTFANFLQSLQNGRIASALRQSGSEADAASDETGGAVPMNFFRMFRFGSSTATGSTNNRSSQHPTANSEHDRSATPNPSSDDDNDAGPDGRMVPIIIVGIRSITPGSPGADATDPSIPPFFDALSSFPSPLGSPGAGALDVDSLLRPPGAHHGTTRFSHRRRASMGGMSAFPSSYENQRHSRTPLPLGSSGGDRERQRPVSMMGEPLGTANATATSTSSNTPTGPRPPPSTPASQALSAFSSGTTTPTQDGGPLRRNGSLLRASSGGAAASTLDAPAARGTPRHRRLSESDFTRFGAGAARRNGVVGTDAAERATRAGSPYPASAFGNAEREREREREGSEAGSGSGSRSWIIYVLGGQYPENHPILTTPSLFTDSPTYEDMLLLSALLGPAKPPVASREDVREAGGVFRVVVGGEGKRERGGEEGEREGEEEEEGRGQEKRGLMALPTEGEEEGFRITGEERCLVCLCDFEAEEEVRKLVKCSHLFHRECIDQWLTTGRNSCPLCRGQGVDEKTGGAASATTDDAPMPPPASSAEVA